MHIVIHACLTQGARQAPVVDFVEDWSKVIVQRAEAQLRRDIQFPFAVWSLVFRTIVNIGSNLYAVSRVATKDSEQDCDAVDGEVFRDAALTILQALGDRYTCGDRTLAVNGDLQKVWDTPGVRHNKTAQKMLSSLQATFQRIAGTQEIRTMMRHEITAFRVFYGVPIMVTFAPNEKQSTLMIRLSRTRRSDPFMECMEVKKWKRDWGARDQPELVERTHDELNEEETVDIPIEPLLDLLPDSDTRRRIVARDPLACVYGFHALCRIALATLFGVRSVRDPLSSLINARRLPQMMR